MMLFMLLAVVLTPVPAKKCGSPMHDYLFFSGGGGGFQLTLLHCFPVGGILSKTTSEVVVGRLLSRLKSAVMSVFSGIMDCNTII